MRDYQRSIAAALLSGDIAAAAVMIDGRSPPLDRLRIHRNTMLTALANALALTYPAVEALVGAEFFAQAARIFIQAEPPRAALLGLYGEAFPDFLARYEPVRTLPYLPDVARLEWTVEQIAFEPEDEAGPSVAGVDLGGTRLTLVPTLTVLKAGYHAEPIWRAVLEDDGDRLSSVDAGRQPSIYVIWRAGDGAAISRVGVSSAAFLEQVIAGGDAESAINAAAAAAPDGDPIAAITMEILSAGFARLTST